MSIRTYVRTLCHTRYEMDHQSTQLGKMPKRSDLPISGGVFENWEKWET